MFHNDQAQSPPRALGAAGLALGLAVVGVRTARRLMGRGGEQREPLTARTAITVNRPPAEVYAYWRDFQNLPRFMYHLEDVRPLDDRRSHWVAKAPGGTTVEWDAEITDEAENQLIAWRSVEGATVPNAGSVRFAPAPADQGTELLVEIEYSPPGGRAGAAVARLFGEEPEQQMRDDLRRFKQVLETGEVVLSDALPEGTRSARQLHLLQRPGQPADKGQQ